MASSSACFVFPSAAVPDSVSRTCGVAGPSTSDAFSCRLGHRGGLASQRLVRSQDDARYSFVSRRELSWTSTAVCKSSRHGSYRPNDVSCVASLIDAEVTVEHDGFDYGPVLHLQPTSILRGLQSAAAAGVSALEHVRGSGRTTRQRELPEDDPPPGPEVPPLTPEEAAEYRRLHEIVVQGHSPAPYLSFAQTNFPVRVTKELMSQGFEAPTPIQAQAWPVVQSGKDMIGLANTGSGKTLAFVLPVLLAIRKEPPVRPGQSPRVLILAPTRELANQIHLVCTKYGRLFGIRNVCVYGGASRRTQARELSHGAEVIIATPGRLNDFLESREVRLDAVQFLVLDEADRMLDMGFEPQIRQIMQYVKETRQTLLWSATWPREVQKLANDFMTTADPVMLKVGANDLSASVNITQVVHVCDRGEKKSRLRKFLEARQEDSRTLVFSATRSKADSLAQELCFSGFQAVAIHGDKTQGERDRALRDFRSGRSPIMIATDVVARGLDVKNVEYVVNFDMPNSVEDYVHRIGRTGRAGNTGTAISYLTAENFKLVNDLVRLLDDSQQEVTSELRGLVTRRSGSRSGGGISGAQRSGGGDGGRSRPQRAVEGRSWGGGRDREWDRRRASSAPPSSRSREWTRADKSHTGERDWSRSDRDRGGDRHRYY